MSIMEWVIWAVTETIKYYLISYGIFGCEVKKGIAKYTVFLYLVIGIPVMMVEKYDKIFFTSFWGLFFLCLFFQGQFRKKIQMIILQYIAITVVDTSLWSFMFLLKNNMGWNSDILTMTSEIAGTLFWIFIFLRSRKYRNSIKQLWEELPVKYYILIVSILLGIGFISADTFAVVNGEMTEKMGQIAYVICNIVLILVIIGCIIFAKSMYSKQQLQIEKKYNQINLDVQKKYYARIQEKILGLREFRHDVNKHIRVLRTLCQQGEIDSIRNYVEDLDGIMRETKIVYTGNQIVDGFINQLYEKFEGNHTYELEVSGRLPERLPLSDVETGILFGNAIDNAMEALEKCKDSGMFKMQIQRYQDTLFVEICNTAPEKEGELLETEKLDKRNHGIGTKNMRTVVQKNKGEIEWSQAKGIFTVKITLVL